MDERLVFIKEERLINILEIMGSRGNILGGGFFCVVLCLLIGWLVWAYIHQSNSRVWESSETIELPENSEARGVANSKNDIQEDANTEELNTLPTNQSEGELDTQSSSPAIPSSANDAKKEKIIPRSEKQTESSDIQKKLVDFGFEKAERKVREIDTVVLHSSFNNQGGDQYSVEKVMSIWESYEVAPHFVIDRKGNILQLVLEHDIAYHAGVSQMKDGRKNVNDFSLGVEILNAEDDTYTEAQYTAVKNLVSYLKKTYPIKYVVGHDTIAPGRKTDPWNFDWKKLE